MQRCKARGAYLIVFLKYFQHSNRLRCSRPHTKEQNNNETNEMSKKERRGSATRSQAHPIIFSNHRATELPEGRTVCVVLCCVVGDKR